MTPTERKAREAYERNRQTDLHGMSTRQLSRLAQTQDRLYLYFNRRLDRAFLKR